MILLLFPVPQAWVESKEMDLKHKVGFGNGREASLGDIKKHWVSKARI